MRRRMGIHIHKTAENHWKNRNRNTLQNGSGRKYARKIYIAVSCTALLVCAAAAVFSSLLSEGKRMLDTYGEPWFPSLSCGETRIGYNMRLQSQSLQENLQMPAEDHGCYISFRDGPEQKELRIYKGIGSRYAPVVKGWCTELEGSRAAGLQVGGPADSIYELYPCAYLINIPQKGGPAYPPETVSPEKAPSFSYTLAISFPYAMEPVSLQAATNMLTHGFPREYMYYLCFDVNIQGRIERIYMGDSLLIFG